MVVKKYNPLKNHPNKQIQDIQWLFCVASLWPENPLSSKTGFSDMFSNSVLIDV